MPIVNQASTDEDYSYDICPEFSGGMASASRANLLNQNQAAFMQNCEFDTQGIVRTRRGTRGILGAPQTILGGITVNLPNNKANTFVNSNSSANSDLCYAVQNFGSGFAIASGGTGLFSPGVYVSTTHGQTGTYYSDGQLPVVFYDGITAVTKPTIPTGSIVAWHTNRLFVAGIKNRPSTLQASGILNDTLWLANFSIDIGTNDGDRIVAIQPYQDEFLVVFKQNSIWIVDADPTATNAQGQLSAGAWTIKNISRTQGCVAPRTVCIVGEDVWFMSQDGVRVIKRAPATEQQFDITDPVSAPVRDYIRRFNRGLDPGTACAICFEGQYLLALPLDGDTSNSLTLVYREITKSWQGAWTIRPSIFFVDTVFSPQRLLIGMRIQLFGGGAADVLAEWMSYYQDFQADPSCFLDVTNVYSTILRTRSMIFGEIMSGKQFQQWEAEFFNSRSANTAISCSVDSGPDTPLLSIDTEANPPLTFPITLPATLPALGVKRRGSNLRQLCLDGRELQMTITNTDGLPISFRYLSAAACVQPVKFETN